MELCARKNIRLKGYDYSRSGCYFITICTKNQQELLWSQNAVGAAFGRPPLTETGTLIETEIKKIGSFYDNVQIDIYVIMPNHIHMIMRLSEIVIVNGRPKAAPTVSRILNKFKGSITKQLGYSIWQKLFHDHIIRTKEEYQKIWKYIEKNPARWEEDCYHVV